MSASRASAARARAGGLFQRAIRLALLAIATMSLLAISAGAVAIAAPSGALAASCHESGEAGRLYTVTLCITTPEDGATLTGTAPVSATVTVSGVSPGIRRLTFFLGGAYLLTDYEAPYQFELPTARFVDGPRTLEVEAWMRDGYITERTAAALVFQNGVTTPPVNTNTFTPSQGTDPGAGSLVIGAAGDGAGGEQSGAAAVDLIASWNPNLFLYLGDVYEKGTATEFDNWYRPVSAYGRFRAITNPTIGNHEYQNGAAPGYFDYWDNAPHYFSVNTHGWHLISLDTNTAFGQTAPGTPQYQWLVDDLAANTQPCTLVYYHQPLYNIGQQGSSSHIAAIWSLLAQHGVDLVVNGHDHTYQRWQPLDGSGNPSPSGVTEIIVGTGGHGLGTFVTTDNRVAASATEFGALRLDLNSGGATYQFITTQGQTRDSGSIACGHGETDTTPPTRPSGLTATATYKTNIDLSWTASTDNVGVTGYRIFRNGQLLTTVGPGVTYSDGSVLAGSTHTYTVTAIDAASNESGGSNAATATTPTTGVLFQDGFESGDFSRWTQADGLTAQQSEVFAGSYAARGAPSGAGRASAHRQLAAPETNLYFVTRFKVLNQAPATNINLLRFRNNLGPANPIATAFVSSTNRIGVRNDVTAVATTGTTVATRGAWHTLQVHAAVNGATSDIAVWLDGVPVPGLALNDVDLGPNPIGRLELGDSGTAKTYDIVYDEVAYDREFVADVVAPTAPTNLAAVASAGPRVDLTWAPSTDDTGVVGYDVYRNGSLLATIPAASTYADTSVSRHTAYSYRVRARDAAGNVSGFSGVASATTGGLFEDGFESGNLSRWTSVAGLSVQQQLVRSGTWAARARSNGDAGSSAQVTLAGTRSDLYYRTLFRLVSQGTNSVSLLRFRTAANAPLSSVSVGSTGKLTYRNDTTGVSMTTGQPVPTGTWHDVQVRLRVNGDASQVDVWLNGASVLSVTQSLGTTPIGRLELGDPAAGRSFDVAFDNVRADAELITGT